MGLRSGVGVRFVGDPPLVMLGDVVREGVAGGARNHVKENLSLVEQVLWQCRIRSRVRAG